MRLGDPAKWSGFWRLAITTAISLFAGLVPMMATRQAFHYEAAIYEMPSPPSWAGFALMLGVEGVGLAWMLSAVLLLPMGIIVAVANATTPRSSGRTGALVGGVLIAALGAFSIWRTANPLNLAAVLAGLGALVGGVVFCLVFVRIYRLRTLQVQPPRSG